MAFSKNKAKSTEPTKIAFPDSEVSAITNSNKVMEGLGQNPDFPGVSIGTDMRRRDIDGGTMQSVKVSQRDQVIAKTMRAPNINKK